MHRIQPHITRMTRHRRRRLLQSRILLRPLNAVIGDVHIVMLLLARLTLHPGLGLRDADLLSETP